MQFSPLGIEDKPRVDAALAADPPEISELTFTNLFVWLRKRRVSTAWSAGALLLLAEERGRRFYLPPVGAPDPVAAVRELVAHAVAAGFPPVVERAPASLAAALAAAGFRVTPDRDNADYVYETARLATLAGRPFDGKRNQIRRLLETHRCEYVPLDDDAAQECLALEEDWCDLRSCALDEGLEAEREAIAACFRLRETLALSGGAVRVDGRVKAFALAERLAPGTAVVHFEKADPGIPGLYQLVNSRVCREALAGFAFVNREQDLGIPGLRRAKESYRPHHLVEKFAAAPREMTERDAQD